MDTLGEQVQKTIHAFKNSYFDDPQRYTVLVKHHDEAVGRLRPVPTVLKGEAAQDAVLQTDWRNLHKDSFFVPPFTATVERTMKWLEETYFHDDTVLIFIVQDADKTPIGHLGFSNFDFPQKQCEYGRVLRGAWGRFEQERKINVLNLAQHQALKWALDIFSLEKIMARVFADNWLALNHYLKCGFYPVEKYSVERHDGPHEVMRIELTRQTLKA